MKLYELTSAYRMLLDAEDSEEFALGLAQDVEAIIEAYKRGETVLGTEVSIGQHLVIR